MWVFDSLVTHVWYPRRGCRRSLFSSSPSPSPNTMSTVSLNLPAFSSAPSHADTPQIKVFRLSPGEEADCKCRTTQHLSKLRHCIGHRRRVSTVVVGVEISELFRYGSWEASDHNTAAGQRIGSSRLQAILATRGDSTASSRCPFKYRKLQESPMGNASRLESLVPGPRGPHTFAGDRRFGLIVAFTGTAAGVSSSLRLLAPGALSSTRAPAQRRLLIPLTSACVTPSSEHQTTAVRRKCVSLVAGVGVGVVAAGLRPVIRLYLSLPPFPPPPPPPTPPPPPPPLRTQVGLL